MKTLSLNPTLVRDLLLRQKNHKNYPLQEDKETLNDHRREIMETGLTLGGSVSFPTRHDHQYDLTELLPAGKKFLEAAESEDAWQDTLEAFKKDRAIWPLEKFCHILQLNLARETERISHFMASKAIGLV